MPLNKKLKSESVQLFSRDNKIFMSAAGPLLKHNLPQMAKLRIDVFKEYPYLYDGNFNYERRYLSRYLTCPESFVGLIFAADGTSLLGMTTAMPLRLEEKNFQQAFIEKGIPLEKVCYFGELLLRPEVRSQGLGHHLMKWNMQYARQHSFEYASLACVDRSGSPNLIPLRHRPLDAFWKKYGFECHPEMVSHYTWKDMGADQESEKPMIFWLKDLTKGED